MSNSIDRAPEILKSYENRFPNIWKIIESKRSSLSALPNWPDWCFLPLVEWYNALNQGIPGGATPFDLATQTNRIAAVGAWRYSQRIYQFETQLSNKLAQTRFDGNLPCEALRELPDWCVYIETVNFEQFGSQIRGFWAQLMWDTETKCADLLIVFDLENKLTSTTLTLGRWSLRQAIEQNINFYKIHTNTPVSRRYIRNVEKQLSVVLNKLLYLCYAKEHCNLVGGTGSLYSSKSNKEQLVVPSAPEVWRVGESA